MQLAFNKITGLGVHFLYVLKERQVLPLLSGRRHMVIGQRKNRGQIFLPHFGLLGEHLLPNIAAVLGLGLFGGVGARLPGV